MIRAFKGRELNSSFINDGKAFTPKIITTIKRYLTQDISNLISNPKTKIIEIAITLIIIADFDKSISGDNKKLIKPRPAEIRNKFDDLM